MSTSACIIIAEDKHLPIVLYKLSDGGIIEYSPRYDRLAGTGKDLFDMVMRYEKRKLYPSAETIANEYMMLSHDCRIADCIHEDVEFIYTLQLKTTSPNNLRMCSFKTYAVQLWKFTSDLASPVWKIATWINDQVPSEYFEHRYLIRELGSLIKGKQTQI